MHDPTDDSNNIVRMADPDTWNFLFVSETNREEYAKRKEAYLKERNDPKNIMMRKIDKARRDCNKCWTCWYFPNHYTKCMECTHIAEKIK